MTEGEHAVQQANFLYFTINAFGRNIIPFPVMRYTNKSGYG